METSERVTAPHLCRSTDEDNSDAQLQAWHLILNFVSSAAVKAACVLQIPDLLAREGPLTLEEILAHLRSEAPDADYLYRLLRFLCTKGVFSVKMGQNSVELRSDPKYCSTPVSKLLVQEKNESSLGAMALFVTSTEIQASAFNLAEGVLQAGGRAFDKVNGTDLWSFANSNSRFNELFNKAMAGSGNILIKSILEHYHGFHNIDTLVDAGGGIGAAISLIKARYPSMKAINFDLPHVVATAPSVSGVEHVGGDMFESIPAADGIFMMRTLHALNDKDCVKALKMCRKAIREAGKLIIVEMILERDEDRASLGEELKTEFDLMMTSVVGGKERSRELWEALLREAGFQQCSIIDVPGVQYSVIEAFPDA